MDGIAIAGLVIAAIALLYTALTYKKDHVDKTKDGRAHLLAQFNANRTLTKQVIDSLKGYTSKRNSLDSFMFPNITYRSYIEELEEGLSNGNLSVMHLDFIRREDMTAENINSMVRSLEAQFQALQEIQTTTRLLMKS